jgi:2-keto-4-pentenoate hydratase/2-oxohepta-3-ene-1,7-dioic acid hydratase in catechol pathway
MTFSLATIKHNDKPTPVIEVDEQYYPLATAAPQLLQPEPNRGLMNLFNDWAKSETALVALAESLRKSKAGAIAKAPANSDFMTPLQYPNKLVLGGANYYEHMHKDAKMPDFRKENAIPVFFLKAPTTSLVGCGKTVRYPTQSTKFDWEVELAVIMGKMARYFAVKDALSTVAAYAVGIDLSARDWQFHPKHPFKFDLFGGKSFDDSCPLGPKIVPARFVENREIRERAADVGSDAKRCVLNRLLWHLARFSHRSPLRSWPAHGRGVTALPH